MLPVIKFLNNILLNLNEIVLDKKLCLQQF